MAGSNDVLLKVDNLSKVFPIYRRPIDLLSETLTNKKRHEDYWALREISFELRKGDIMALVGANGAGKSTLVKILAGTLSKTAGNVQINGSVSAIIELGTSFQDEMTGRENIRTALLFAGVSEQNVSAKMDWIIDFSGLEPVIDNVFRTYSSGMQARLTFAAAAASDGDLLIIDEALAAGDASFVEKSLSHVEKMCARDGTAAILVSHSMPTLTRLCNCGMYLKKGESVFQGDIIDIAREYETVMLQQDEDLLLARREVDGDGSHVASSHNFKITGVDLFCNGAPADMLIVGGDCEIHIKYVSQIRIDDAFFIVEVYARDTGRHVTSLSNLMCRSGDLRKRSSTRIDIEDGAGTVALRLNPLLLGSGGYFCHIIICNSDTKKRNAWTFAETLYHFRYAFNFRVRHEDARSFERTMTVESPLEMRTI